LCRCQVTPPCRLCPRFNALEHPCTGMCCPA
jgi:hypothetical protein